MCEERVVTVVLSDDLKAHVKDCADHYWAGLYSGLAAGVGIGIILGGIIAKLASVW
jgi:hypothetical protein